MIGLKNVDGLAAELVATVFVTLDAGTWRLVPSDDPDWVPMAVADAARELVAGRSVVVLPGDVDAVRAAVKALQALGVPA